jgi:3-hydroxybutyrate dehydrogenase
VSEGLASKIAIVTGAAGGLGSTVCEKFRQEGAQVLPVDVSGDDVFRSDVATVEGNRLMVREALRRFGAIDVLVLNAGVQFMSPISEFPVEEWDHLTDVMVKGPFFAMKFAWEELVRKPGGRIVVTASVSSFLAEPYKAAYVAAKHAVVGLVKVAAIEGASAGLTVNAVAPGLMMTPLIERQMADQMRLHGLSRDAVLAQMVERHPAKRAVKAEEVAEAIAFLSSKESSGINGVVVPVDVGLMAS